VTTDICGKRGSHATRLDAGATEAIKNARLHRKAITAIFFESNGGQAKTDATVPEIRFAVAEPGLDIGNVETALEALTEGCYYLAVERNRYHFSLKENLNKRFADRRATIPPAQVEEQIREEIQKVFNTRNGLERIFFPEKTIQIADRPAVTLIVLSPDQSLADEKATTAFVESMIRDYGTSSRTFKSSIIFCVPEAPDTLREDARKVLAWEAIDDDDLKLDETQVHQLAENLKKARRDLKETIWRTYKNLMLLGKDNTVKRVDLGLVHSSAATDLVSLIVTRLSSDGDLETKGISPSFLIRNWPPAFKEWATKSVRDAFFAAPQFPRLTNPEVLKETISRGVGNGLLAYVGKTASGLPAGQAGEYKPFWYNKALMTADVEFSDDMFIITKEAAEAYLKGRATCLPGGMAPPPAAPPTDPTGKVLPPTVTSPAIQPPLVPANASILRWTGDVPQQKWMNFYTKVLSKFASARGLKLTVKVEASPEGGVSKQKLDETKSSLRELGLNEDVTLE